MHGDAGPSSPEPANGPRPQPPAQRTPWIRPGFIPAAIGWALLCLWALSIYGLWFSPGRRRHPVLEQMMTSADEGSLPRGIGFLFGSSIFGVIVLLLGLAARSRSRGRRGRVLMALAAIGLALQITGQLRPTREPGLTSTTTTQSRRAGEDLARILSGAAPAPGEVPSVAAAPAGSTQEHGELSVVVDAVRTLMADMLKSANDYQAGVVALQIDSVLLPIRLDSEEELDASRAKIESARRLFEQYRTNVMTRIDQARATFAASPLPPAQRAQFIHHFNTGVERTRPQTERILAYEDEMYQEMAALLDFMRSRLGTFKVQEQQIIFETGEDVLAYNAAVSRYRAIALRQTELRDLMQEDARNNAARLSESAGAGTTFDAARMARSASIARSPVAVRLEQDGPVLNDRTIAFPVPLATLEELLGPPDRTVAGEFNIRVWDKLGVLAWFHPDGDAAFGLELQLNRQLVNADAPTSAFSGSLSLAGIAVTEVDTPRSLNRRLTGISFALVAEDGSGWALDFPGYSVGMSLEPDGLSDSIFFYQPPPEVPEEPEEVKLRF